MKIVVSVLAWNSTVYLARLFQNLLENPPSTSGFILIVVDQGSTQATKVIIAQAASAIANMRVITLAENIGYSAGHNLAYANALEHGGVDYFVPLNDDMAFEGPGWLDEMVAVMEKVPEAALGGPACYSIVPGMARPATEPEVAEGRYHFIATPVAIIRAAAVRDVGLFDEEYTPAYWEDADLSMRLKHFGWELAHTPIKYRHKYLGQIERGLTAYKAELAKYGEFDKENIARFFTRWKSPETRSAFTRETLWSLCPRLYAPRSQPALDNQERTEIGQAGQINP